MTVAEKSEAIENYCDNRWRDGHTCNADKSVAKCPLLDLRGGCYGSTVEASAVDRNYELLFPISPNRSSSNISSNTVNHPSHYNQGGIECIDAMVAAFGKEAVENFCLCNAFKYVWRNRDKNGFEDIDKAIWYLEKIKELCSD